MSPSEHISLRIDPDLKTQVDNILKSLGLTQSEAIKIYYKQILLNNGLPFSVQLPVKRKNNKALNITKKKNSGDLSLEHQNYISEAFEKLYTKWKEETLFLSNGRKILNHPAYQKIIEMGKIAIPLILNKLNENPDHWSYALSEITGQNPVKVENIGDIETMAKDWLNWGIQNGYINN